LIEEEGEDSDPGGTTIFCATDLGLFFNVGTVFSRIEDANSIVSRSEKESEFSAGYFVDYRHNKRPRYGDRWEKLLVFPRQIHGGVKR
jgi:hypothetical protein